MEDSIFQPIRAPRQMLTSRTLTPEAKISGTALAEKIEDILCRLRIAWRAVEYNSVQEPWRPDIILTSEGSNNISNIPVMLLFSEPE